MTEITKIDGLAGLPRMRIRAGLSQTQLAAQLGVTRQNVCQWESGEAWPSARRLPDIAGALCCTIDELFRTQEDEG